MPGFVNPIGLFRRSGREAFGRNPAAAYMIASTFLFSLMSLAVRFLRDVPLSQVVFFRAVISLVLGWFQIRALGVSPWGNNRPSLILRGCLGTGGLFCYFYTLQHLPLTSAVTLQYMSPIFSAMIAMLFLHERATVWQWIFLLAGFAGVWIMKGVGPEVTALTLAVGVAGAAFSAVAYALIRKLARTDHAYVVVFYFPLVTVPVVVPLVWTHWTQPTAPQWIALVAVGVFTHFGQICMTRAYQSDQVVRTTHFNYLQIVFAAAWGGLFLHEGLTARAALGIAVILCANVLSSLRKVRAAAV